MKPNQKKWLFYILTVCLLLQPQFNIALAKSSSSNEESPIYGDYGAEIREKAARKDGLFHINTPRLIEKLKELKVNTYYFLIWHEASDWDDLRKEFLPAAKKAGINVWVYLVPPTESKSFRSEPYGTDYIAWFQAIGRLSRTQSNLKGIVIDDFNDNTSFFSPYYLKKMKLTAKKENPNLKFYPQVYYPTITPSFVERYNHLIDGIIMTFRDDGYRNTQRIDSLLHQIDESAALLRNHKLPLVLMVYASKLSATPTAPTPAYIEGAIKAALHRLQTKQIAGMITYVLYKEPAIELSEDNAKNGKGYASLFSPANTLPKGAYTELQQQIYIQPKGPYQLRFSQFCFQPYRLEIDAYQTQVLIDHKVIWEKKIKSKNNGKWEQVVVNLTPYLKGKKSAVLSLRLNKTRGGSSGWAYCKYDNLVPEGLALSNGHFEEAQQEWTTVCNNRTMISDILSFDPERRLKSFNVVKKHYTAFYIYEKIAHLFNDPYLLQKANYFFRSVLLDQGGEAQITLYELATYIQKYKKGVPPLQKKLLDTIYKFMPMLKMDKSKQ